MGYPTNYFIGQEAITNVDSFQEVWYFNIYDNVDLRYFMSDNGLKYEFIVHPGGDPNDIKLSYSNDVKLKVEDKNVAIS